MSEHSDNLLTSLHISLRDKNNGTFRGNIVLKNWTTWYQGYAPGAPALQEPDVVANNATSSDEGLMDSIGASYYVIAVILVYGMSIVALIASHIKRKKAKLVEDRQINKYLKEFQIVKEQCSRESYKNLKKRIKEQIRWDKPQNKHLNSFHRNLSHALLPMIAVGVSVPVTSHNGSMSSINIHSRSQSLGQISLGGPRSRTSSVSSNSNMQVLASGERSPVTRERHSRKRGLANLFTGTTNTDVPLEKILEESMESWTSSMRRKGSKICKHSSPSSAGSTPEIYDLNQSQNHASLSNDFIARYGELAEVHTRQSVETSIPRIQLQVPQNNRDIDQSMYQNPVARDSRDNINSQAMETKKNYLTVPDPNLGIPALHAQYPKSSTNSNSKQNAHLLDEKTSKRSRLKMSPTQRSLSDEQIWVTSSLLSRGSHHDRETSEEAYNNRGFRHSPSPVKSRDPSPSAVSRIDCIEGSSTASADYPGHYGQMLDSSDSETEQLLQITCV